MTQSPSETLTPYAPLPVRARGTLEIFDTALKLFRRYAGVLLAWSALSSLINLIPVLGGLLYIFTMPLMFGAVSCVVAAAVRGQNVSFKQVWGFTKPRYGALLGVLILAMILMGIVAFVLLFVIGLVVILVGAAASNYGWFATGVAWIVGVIAGLIGGSFLLAIVMGWFNLAPVIACLEDANRGSNALSRAWSLMAGNWRKACGVATILTLAGTAAFLIIFGFLMFFFYGGWDKFVGANTDVFSGLAFSGFATLFFVVWTPLQAVVGAVFYLDLRTRKEALDLEWTNYAAKPETLTTTEQVAPTAGYASAPPPNFAGGPPYAPASTQSAGPPPPPNFPPPPQGTGFSGQAPVAPPPVGVAPADDSFAAFAAQIESAPQNIGTVPPSGINIEKAASPAPVTPPPIVNIEKAAETVEVQAVEFSPTPPVEPAVPFQVAPPEPPVVVQPEPPVVVQPEPPVFVQPKPPVVVQPEPPIVAVPTFGTTNSGATREVELPPIAVEPTPPVPPVIPAAPSTPPVAEPEETSSFAPRRFRRPANEDDDYPSSFGGGGR
ncbi:hypothetical protein EON83_18975 [bacterium]|nr:MAG: hypothetical protein EON83_18975 [bacterium]